MWPPELGGGWSGRAYETLTGNIAGYRRIPFWHLKDVIVCQFLEIPQLDIYLLRLGTAGYLSLCDRMKYWWRLLETYNKRCSDVVCGLAPRESLVIR